MFDLPLRIRGWRGPAAESGTDSSVKRLYILDASGQLLGFVSDLSRLLYLQAQSEPDRRRITEHVREMGLDVRSAALLADDKLRGGSKWQLSPGREDRIYISIAMDWWELNAALGVYYQDSRELDCRAEGNRKAIENLLYRAGIATREFPPIPFTSRTGEETLRQRANRFKAARGPAGRSFQRPLDWKPPGPTGKAKCASEFPGISDLPEVLRLRACARLQFFHEPQSHEPVPDGTPGDSYWEYLAPSLRTYAEYDLRSIEVSVPEGLMPPNVDERIDSVIEAYRGYFPAIVAYQFCSEQPDLAAFMRAEWDRAAPVFSRRKLNKVRLRFGEEGPIGLLASSLYKRTLQRRSWPNFDLAPCVLCAEIHNPNDGYLPDVFSWGVPFTCRRCMNGTWEYTPSSITSESFAPSPEGIQSILEGIRYTFDVFPLTATQPVLSRMPRFEPLDRDMLLSEIHAALVWPYWPELLANDPSANWNDWLYRAGVTGEFTRASRGLTSRANDGHPCRSLLERAVDDFMSENSIPHGLEPTYPWHPTLNASGNRRADWLLPGGTYVEAAGLMGAPEYSAKMAEKALLAETFGIELIVIEPADATRLTEVLANFMK
jgi:hypothetical protein